MNTLDNRRDQRLKHLAKVRVFASPNIANILNMRDFSDSGLFLLCADTSKIHIGDDVQVQTLEFDDAPIVPAKVRRIEQHIGYAIEFILD
jgi:hypothetical protein